MLSLILADCPDYSVFSAVVLHNHGAVEVVLHVGHEALVHPLGHVNPNRLLGHVNRNRQSCRLLWSLQNYFLLLLWSRNLLKNYFLHDVLRQCVH
jgi:hypothetical protein